MFSINYETARHYLEKMLKNRTETLQDAAKLALAILFAIRQNPLCDLEKSYYYINLIKQTVTDPEILKKADEVKSIIDKFDIFELRGYSEQELLEIIK